jgi:hypothetical protein
VGSFHRYFAVGLIVVVSLIRLFGIKHGVILVTLTNRRALSETYI